MMNYYLVNSNGKYLNTENDKPKFVDKKLATRYDDEFSAEYMGDIYCNEYTIEAESFDR